MSDWNPTDDDLRRIDGNPDYPRGTQALARLVLRERGIARECNKMALHRAEIAEADLAAARAAIVRVEALCADADKPGPFYVELLATEEIRAALTPQILRPEEGTR